MQKSRSLIRDPIGSRRPITFGLSTRMLDFLNCWYYQGIKVESPYDLVLLGTNIGKRSERETSSADSTAEK